MSRNLSSFPGFSANLALDDLSDVTAPAPTTDDLISWNGSMWSAMALSITIDGGVVTYTPPPNAGNFDFTGSGSTSPNFTF